MASELTTYGSADLATMRADAAKYPRIGRMSKDEAMKGMVHIIGNALVYTGREVNDADVATMAGSLLAELLMDRTYGAGNLSLAEINYAVRKGILTEEVYGINVVSLYKLIINYCKGEGHLAQLEAEKRMQAQVNGQLAQMKADIAPMLTTYAGKMLKKK